MQPLGGLRLGQGHDVCGLGGRSGVIMMIKPRVEQETEQPFAMLTVGDHRYLFQYQKGQEAALISCLMDYARDDRFNLGWLEALLLIRQLDL